jgi:hypothetical protein
MEVNVAVPSGEHGCWGIVRTIIVMVFNWRLVTLVFSQTFLQLYMDRICLVYLHTTSLVILIDTDVSL